MCTVTNTHGFVTFSDSMMWHRPWQRMQDGEKPISALRLPNFMNPIHFGVVITGAMAIQNAKTFHSRPLQNCATVGDFAPMVSGVMS